MSDDECDALAGINTLDQASIVKRRLGDAELTTAVRELLGASKFYSLTHALLAALPVREVVTTNYDQLFEEAWGHPVADDITILLTGSNPGRVEPLAWTRDVNGGRVFYTSLGNPETFEDEEFRKLLAQAIFWTARREPELKPAK